jgi:hypothetical protein
MGQDRAHIGGLRFDREARMTVHARVVESSPRAPKTAEPAGRDSG